jgi:GTP1/Obg family GTP-binding protein
MRCIPETEVKQLRRQPCLVVLSKFDELEQRKIKASEAWAQEANKERRIEYQHMEEKRRIWDQQNGDI